MGGSGRPTEEATAIDLRGASTARQTAPAAFRPGQDQGFETAHRSNAREGDGAEKETLDGVLKKLEQETNRDVNEALQDISTAGTFIDDMSLVAMAEEVGTGDMYRSTMGPASSALHGDWSALDDLYLDRCMHPLHGSHVLPRLEPAEESRESLPFLAETFCKVGNQRYFKATDYEPPTSPEVSDDVDEAENVADDRL